MGCIEWLNSCISIEYILIVRCPKVQRRMKCVNAICKSPETEPEVHIW